MKVKNKYCAYIHIHTCQISNKNNICGDTYIKTEFNGKPQLVWDNIKTIIKSFKDNYCLEQVAVEEEPTNNDEISEDSNE